MSDTYIAAELRRLVEERAKYRCEYCLLHRDDAIFAHHCDHVVSEKHGGVTDETNLAFCCATCNLYKGSDIASFASDGKLTPLFHPRRNRWNTHFELNGARIEAKTRIGEVTVRLLVINAPARVLRREALILAKRYPR